jgi:ribosomal protein S12 methylthiotransferase accessory factor
MTTAAMLDIDLGSPDGSQLLAAVAHAHGPAVARAASLATRSFLLRAPWAPGLRCAGAEFDPARLSTAWKFDRRYHVAGSGQTIEDAFASCVAEGVERLSQLERPGDLAGAGSLLEPPGAVMPAMRDGIEERWRPARNTRVDWVAAHMLPDGVPVLVPADWCLRRAVDGPLADPATPLSTGTAAGRDHEDAALRAILELVERDAAALWWVGGNRARSLSMDSPTVADAAALLSALRHGGTQRVTWLLDITSDLQVPCVAALSVDPDGRGLSCGLAARAGRPQAARAAILELCQMEVALLLSRHRRATGAALTDLDQRHLDRATAIDAERYPLIHPFGIPSSEAAPAADAGLRDITAILARQGVEVALVDLSRPEYGIPVVHAVAPALQLMPSEVMTARLRRMIAETGGGERFTQGVRLL